jgi:Sulfotransferase family
VLAARSLRVVNRALDRYETRGDDPGPLPYPPILIVGAPRSGSTLLYQAMVQRFDVAYISNRHCRLNGAPSLVERRFAGAAHRPTYTSNHGFERGATAPSECGAYWYRFFPRSPHHVTLAAADPAALARLRRSVARFSDAAERPVVFKNLYCSLRLEPIAHALPEALFLVMHRDLLENARSLLAGRKRRSGDYAVWWSAEPPGIERIRTLPPAGQAVEQVRAIEGAIDEARAAIGDRRFFDVEYGRLCDEPGAVLAAVAAFAAGAGVTLTPSGEIPKRFERPPVATLTPELEQALVRDVAAR